MHLCRFAVRDGAHEHDDGLLREVGHRPRLVFEERVHARPAGLERLDVSVHLASGLVELLVLVPPRALRADARELPQVVPRRRVEVVLGVEARAARHGGSDPLLGEEGASEHMQQVVGR